MVGHVVPVDSGDREDHSVLDPSECDQVNRKRKQSGCSGARALPTCGAAVLALELDRKLTVGRLGIALAYQTYVA